MLKNKDKQWMELCEAAAPIFSTCSKAQVFSVIVNENQRIVSTGYNGVPSGWLHCTQGGCPRAKSNVPSGSNYDEMPGLCWAAHAEINALSNGDGTQYPNSTLYVNKAPCMNCQRAIAGAGLARIVCPAPDWNDDLLIDSKMEVFYANPTKPKTHRGLTTDPRRIL